jgi:hypothetical protein
LCRSRARRLELAFAVIAQVQRNFCPFPFLSTTMAFPLFNYILVQRVKGKG